MHKLKHIKVLRSTFALLILFLASSCDQSTKETDEPAQELEHGHVVDSTITDTLQKIPFWSIRQVVEKSRMENKKGLIYFAADSSIKSTEIEETYLNDPEIISLINQRYLLFTSFIDYSEPDLRTDKSFGEEHFKIMRDSFNCQTVPYFVILDDEGKVHDNLKTPNDQEEFILFLTQDQ